MAYFAPYIDEHGIHVPEYQDIKDRLVSAFRRIFGEDLYLESDSQDGQMIAEFADCYDDLCSLAVDLYASRDPDLATGVSLDLMLPVNGIRRFLATYSTATVTLVGIENTVIPAGSLIQDTDGNQWATDTSATIGQDGTATVTVTCCVPGAVNAAAGSISQIMNPTAGWTSVSNASEATAGRNTETDAEVHARRSASVSNSAVSMVESIRGYLMSLDGVSKTRVYENKESETNADGLPGHSICAVVLGGDSNEIAAAVFRKKGPGPNTYGNTSVTIKDVYGNDNVISFSRPTEKEIVVSITIKRLDGYVDSVTGQIKNNIRSYIESLGIGENLNVGMLWGCILAANVDISSPICTPISVSAGIKNGTMKTDTVTIGYADNMTCAIADITVTVSN